MIRDIAIIEMKSKKMSIRPLNENIQNIGSFNKDARNLLDHSSCYDICQICCELFSTVWQIIMEGHSVEQRVQIIKFYYQNQCSVRETFRPLRDFYPHHNRPAKSIIRRLVAKFESTGSINNQPTYVAETQDLLKTSLLCVRVYGKTRSGQFLVIHKNLAFL